VKINLRFFGLITLSVTTCLASSQSEPVQKPSTASMAYHNYRTAITEPNFGLVKVKGLIRKIKSVNYELQKLSDDIYRKLSFEEKFTYHLIHGEVTEQNCGVMPPIIDEHKEIFGQPNGAFNDDTYWGENQILFFKNNRSKVIDLTRKTIQLRQRAGSNIKQLVVEINAVELIPDLVKVFNIKRKDFDILSILMVLMKENKFEPFLKSQSYTKLYDENASYRTSISANNANINLILERAQAFYKSKK
jgi:hypothetical protein